MCVERHLPNAFLLLLPNFFFLEIIPENENSKIYNNLYKFIIPIIPGLNGNNPENDDTFIQDNETDELKMD